MESHSHGNRPLVSVIIPTYNRHRWLGDAIGSVLAQTYHRVEVIVVDDGSTDATAALLARYRNRIRVIRQSNRGVSAARNRGIGEAAGEYIALLDSDDFWMPEKLAAQIAYFTARPDMLICQTEEIWIRNGMRINPKKRHRKQAGFIFERCLPLCLISPSAVMLHASLLDTVGLFDENLPACEDYDFWLRVTCRYPVGLIEHPLIVKRGGHADQLSAMAELDKYRIVALSKVLDSGLLSRDQFTAAFEMLARKCRIYSQGCRKRGRAEQAHRFEALIERYGLTACADLTPAPTSPHHTPVPGSGDNAPR
jgi:glycosyltransferase involved in cell wall biosynthesis